MAFKFFSTIFLFSIISDGTCVINKVFYDYDLYLSTPALSLLLTPQTSTLTAPTAPQTSTLTVPIAQTAPTPTAPSAPPAPTVSTTPWTLPILTDPQTTPQSILNTTVPFNLSSSTQAPTSPQETQKTISATLSPELIKAWRDWFRDFIRNNSSPAPTTQIPITDWKINMTTSITIVNTGTMTNEGREWPANNTELDKITENDALLIGSVDWTAYLGAAAMGLALISFIYVGKKFIRDVQRRRRRNPPPPPSREELEMSTLTRSNTPTTLPSRRARMARIMQSPYNDLTQAIGGALRRSNTLPRSFILRSNLREDSRLESIQERIDREVTVEMGIIETELDTVDETLAIDTAREADEDNVSWGTDWGDNERSGGEEEIYLAPIISSPTYEEIR